MITQNIKALCLFISAAMMTLGISEYSYDTQSFLGFVWSAMAALLLSNIVDLFDKWITEKRKVDLLKDDRMPWHFRREADIFVKRKVKK